MTFQLTDSDIQTKPEPDIKIEVRDLFTVPPQTIRPEYTTPPLPNRRLGHEKKILIGIIVLFISFLLAAGTLLTVLNRGKSYHVPLLLPESTANSTPPVLTVPQNEKSIAEITALAKKTTVKIQTETKTLWGLTATQYHGTGIAVARKQNYVLILTNQHVIENGTKYEIYTSDYKRYIGKVVALPKTNIDLALMVIEDKTGEIVPSLPIGDYSSVVQGSEVVAFGHPEGLEFSVTRGIVSALREGLFIQTDAAINHGNSGGPLISRTGQVIGINTFMIRNSHTEGLGFAIRADYVLQKEKWNCFEDFTPLWNELLKQKN
ncbi:MAG: trypsin-like peptidase domain-containing protein [Planctomycetaceae bacterium]|jgi:S1-C subfamily serine protease|nr:trypsin-like peptidase domain-containing protein [Planctomycetaceae bacterium]